MIPYCNFYLKAQSVHPWICMSRESPGKSYMHFEGLWYSMRFPCIVYSLETGGEGTLSNSFKFIRTCFKFMVHSLAEGCRWCPGLAIDVRLLDRDSFNIGIAFFHGTTCFILILPSLNISYGKRLIWKTRKIWNETFNWNELGHLSTSILVFTLINVPLFDDRSVLTVAMSNLSLRNFPLIGRSPLIF